MKTDGSTCPEDSNSTDCLLRTLLQLLNDNKNADDAETNWDPITFAFTAVIGVIAIMFAFIPIIQAFLAAGKGRRKTSNRAIGKWSKKRLKRWSWSAMSYEYTAQTPVLKAELLSSWPAQTNTEGEPSQQLVELQEDMEEPQRQDEFAATWLGFFKHTGLDVLKTPAKSDGLLARVADYLPDDLLAIVAERWPDFFKYTGLVLEAPAESGGLRAVVADYLPDDLLAAPAYAEVGVIVTAATTTGIQSLAQDKSTGYPILLGRGFQFDFRQHPVLGIVGAYSRYGPTPEKSLIPTAQQLNMSMRYLRGNIQIKLGDWVTYVDMLSRATGHRIADTSQLRSQKSIKCHDYVAPSADSWIVNEDYAAISILFLASTPEHIPALFPNSTMRAESLLTLLALSGTYWLDARLDVLGESALISSKPTWGSWSSIVDVADVDRMNFGDMDYCIRSLERSRERGDYQYEADQGFSLNQKVRGCALVLKMSLKLLSDPKTFDLWFLERPPWTQRFLRTMVLGELGELERWLHSETRTHMFEYRTTVLWNTFFLLSNLRRENLLRTILRRRCEVDAKRTKISAEDTCMVSPEGSKAHGPDHEPTWNEVTSRNRHSDILHILENLLHTFSFSKELTEAISKFELSSNSEHLRVFVEAVDKKLEIGRRFGEDRDTWLLRHIAGVCDADRSEIQYPTIHRMLLRLCAIVYRSNRDYQWLHWHELYKSNEEETTDLGDAKDLDDVIIYRCLLISLLFRTALDPTELLRSGLWEQVVPII